MAAAVLVPISDITSNGGVLPPSATGTTGAARHGRSRGSSIANKRKSGVQGKGFSLAEERDTVISKALAFALRRSQVASGKSASGSDDEEGSGDDASKLSADAEGWVDLDDLLEHPKVAGQKVTLNEVQRVVAGGKTRLALRQTPNSDPSDAASYEVRLAPAPPQAHKQAQLANSAVWTDVTADSADLPEFVVYETSYPKYYLILQSGSIQRAGGQPHLSFTPLAEDNASAGDADVRVWVNFKATMAAKPAVSWKRTESGAYVTGDAVPTSLWHKAVARRGDLGVLFEGGEVRKEIPVGLRGKGAKAKKGKGVLKSGGANNKAAAGNDGSDSGSE